MNKNILKIVLIGIAAGFCISAKATSDNYRYNVAAKCDKEKNECCKEKPKKNKKANPCCKEKNKKKCNNNCQQYNNSYNTTNNEEDLRNNYSNEHYTFGPDEVAATRKSAAQKVMEGY